MDADDTVNVRGDPNTKRVSLSLSPYSSSSSSSSSSSLRSLFSDLTIKKVFLQGIVEMKKRLKEIEEEAMALRMMQAKVEKKMAATAGEGIPTCFPVF